MPEQVTDDGELLHTEAHRLAIDKIYTLLDTSAEGLTESEARQRLLWIAFEELEAKLDFSVLDRVAHSRLRH